MLEKGAVNGSKGGITSGRGVDITWDSRDNNIDPDYGFY
jgi:hypothetical protein